MFLLPLRYGCRIGDCDCGLRCVCEKGRVTTMNDLISRTAALDIYDDYNVAVENGELESYGKYRKQMLALPSVDAVPVEHGKWEKHKGIFICSRCWTGYKEQPTMMGKPLFEFCPVCGAKMDGKDGDNEKAD